ncbi:MAG TPA: adenylate/guanylate cyclase domain-containing protein [Candidatus Limnocylindria bacterium]
MPTLTSAQRSRLPDSAFAYVDSAGTRRLPINDASHVRNALARFDQVTFETDEARGRARDRLLRAAKRYGIVPLGFFDGQLRKERASASGVDMRAWPRGTVTFLLTDIEGSTALLRRLQDGYSAVLRDVRRIIRDAVRAAHGHEVDARADEFFAAFADPRDAVAAAIAIQRGLAERAWPGKAKVCVRIGLHTGRSTLTDAGYVGIAVHTAARICSAGHGGQIVLSSHVIDALLSLHEAADGGVRRRALGEYVLPSLVEPLALYQIDVPGLRTRFPALRTSTARASESR